MYGIVRIIIGCFFLFCSIIAIRRSKIIRKRILYIISSITSLILITVLAFLPFENLFFTFDSPKAAYKYYNFGSSNINLVIKGDKSDFVIASKKDFDEYLIVPKNDNGWKIGIGSNTKRIIQKVSDEVAVYVYQYKDTEDYFITVLDLKGGNSKITDSYGSEFYSFKKTNNSLGKTFTTYYTHISKLDSYYFVTVNDTQIIVNK